MKLRIFQKSNFNLKQKILCLFLIILCIFVVFLIISLFRVEYKLQQLFFSMRNGSEAMNRFAGSGKVNEITLILIDDYSIENLHLTWPIPRSIYGRLIKKINQYGPRVIGIDITFEEMSPVPVEDQRFVDVLREKESDNVVLACRWDIDKDQKIRLISPNDKIKNIWPADAESKKHIGFVDSGEEEVGDGVIRYARLLFTQGEESYYSFDALILSRYLGIPLSDMEDCSQARYLKIGEIIVPVLPTGEMWINYLGHVCYREAEFNVGKDSFFMPSSTGIPYDGLDVVSLKQVMDMDKKEEMEHYFKDKIVLLGVSAVQGYDRKLSPIGLITGPEVHVNILLSLLHQKFLKEASPLKQLFIVFVPSLLLACLLFYLSPLGGLVLSLSLAAGSFIYYYRHFLETGEINYYVSSLVAIFCAYAIISVYNLFLSLRAQTRLRSMLLELAPVPEPVLDTIMQRYKGKIVLGGEKVNLTVLFSDIRGYTALSQNLDPREVMGTLNEYYTAMARIYKKNGGMNFDIMGDGQMIVFGADDASRKAHALMAVKSSVEMIEELEKLNDTWKTQNRKTVTIGIGINTGDVSLGFLGSDVAGHRKQFSAIGDTTNVAARIEGLTKTMNAQVIISETTYELTKDLIIAEELPPAQVKGKDLPLKIYKLIGLKETAGVHNAK